MRIFWSFVSLLVLIALVLILLPTEKIEEFGEALEVALTEQPEGVLPMPVPDEMARADEGDEDDAGGLDPAEHRLALAKGERVTEPRQRPEITEQPFVPGQPDRDDAEPDIVMPPAEAPGDVETPVATPNYEDAEEGAADRGAPADENGEKPASNDEADDAEAPANDATADSGSKTDDESTQGESSPPAATNEAGTGNESSDEPSSEVTATDAESSADDAKPEPASDAAATPGSAAGDVAPAADSEAAAPMTDDRFEVKGSGTKEDPYRITWELLTSAYETYRPREDMEEIPPRIQMLHEKYVKITGYLAFPQLAGEVDEALVMLNQWDGCCLGVPPSPYDSIEVKLTGTMTAQVGAFTPFGTVEGKMLIDPYLVNGWLVGLYIMENAKVETVM